MKRYLIQNKEVFLVTYIAEGEDIEKAFRNWQDSDGDEIDMEYIADLKEYIRQATPDIQEIIDA